MTAVKIIAFVILVAAIAFTALTASRAKATPTPSVNDMAPDFHLLAQDGKPVSLQNYRGRWIVLYFYPKDFTSGCTLEAHGFEANLSAFEKFNTIILGVSIDTAASHKDFCTKEGLNFKLLSDTEHTVSAAYGSLNKLGPVAFAQRNTFIIDPAGKIAKIFLGVKPATHSQEVLAALHSLQTPNP